MAAKNADPESIRLAMDLAWRDHHHLRGQTWRALQMEVVLVAGLIGIDWQIQNIYATIAAGLLVWVAVPFGIQITLRHRQGEIRKFTHIANCEQALGLHREDLLSSATTKLPTPLRLIDAFRPSVSNTSAFILRMHIAILLFSILYVLGRIFLR